MTMDKTKPTLSPDQPEALRETLERAVKDPRAGKDLRVSLEIRGGLVGQSYTFEFEASGKGEVRCSLRCELSGRRGRAKKTGVDTKYFVGLLRAIRDSRVLELPPQQPRFLPDTVIGCFRVTDGTNEYRTYFAADPDQAEVQNLSAPLPLAKAVGAVYSRGAKLIGVRSVKP